jgi:hypothetical protein
MFAIGYLTRGRGISFQYVIKDEAADSLICRCAAIVWSSPFTSCDTRHRNKDSRAIASDRGTTAAADLQVFKLGRDGIEMRV